MTELHRVLAQTIVLYFAAVGVWGIVLGVRNIGPTSSYRGALAIAQVAAIAQALAGLVLVATTGRFDALHALYGAALVLAIPLAATLVRGRTPRGQSIALGLAMLFAAGLAIRGITTAG